MPTLLEFQLPSGFCALDMSVAANSYGEFEFLIGGNEEFEIRAAEEFNDDEVDVLVSGYPYGDIYSNTVKVTKGIVSADRGIGDNSGRFQLDAAVQPGSSGGPIYDHSTRLFSKRQLYQRFPRIVWFE